LIPLRHISRKMNTTNYQNKIHDIQERISLLQKSYSRIGFIRLFVFLIGLALFYFLFSVNRALAFSAFGLILVLFVFIILYQKRLSDQLKDLRKLKIIYENEIEVIQGGTNLFGNGEEFIDGKHPFSGDLDIFGNHSLFNLINRSCTFEGKRQLANELSSVEGDIPEIDKRQKAIQELVAKVDFKEKMLIESIHLKKKKNKKGTINEWLEGFTFSFLSLEAFHRVFQIASLLMILMIPFAFLFSYAYLILFFVIILSTLFNFFHFRKVNQLHSRISKQSEVFANYSRLVSIINDQQFESEKLVSLKNELDKPEQIIRELKILSRLIEQLDYRLNVTVAFFLNIFLFWDIRKSIQIEKWLIKNHTNVPKWLAPIAEMDALLSMSIFSFNHPEFTFPEFTEEKEVYFNATSIGHPLIPAVNRVCNDYDLKGNGYFDIITGSNMAGKTTFLRTIGFNAILAMNGCPVCAKKLSLSPFRIMTYMRITDSLEYNLSTFHAEIQRIQDILEFTKQKTPCLLLLDELLKGTNSKDRASGTKVLMKHLVDNGSSGLISTHDLGLTKMEHEIEGRIRNFHFDIVNMDDDLDFDYKLKEGVSQTTNAGMLLRKIGLEVE